MTRLRQRVLLPAVLVVVAGLPLSADQGVFDAEIENIQGQLMGQFPIGSRVLILDMTGLDGLITPFGRYLSNKLNIRLSSYREIELVDRMGIEFALREQELQMADVVDPRSAVKIGRVVGASMIVYGTISELPNAIDLDIKIANVERGTLVGGVSQAIEKTREMSSLVGFIINAEEEQQKELEVYRAQVMAETEAERERRTKAVDAEVEEKRRELAKLNREIDDKAAIIEEYESKKKVIRGQNNYIQQIHAEIDALNASVLDRLKVGMSLNQVKIALGSNSLTTTRWDHIFITGSYYLVFQRDILMKVVRMNSVGDYNMRVTDPLRAESYGRNVAKY